MKKENDGKSRMDWGRAWVMPGGRREERKGERRHESAGEEGEKKRHDEMGGREGRMCV